MKNLKYIFLSFAIVFLSCESELDKTYDELGNIPSPIKTDLKYTLAEEDYASIDATSKTDDYEIFNGIPSEEDAIQKLPAVILSKLVRVEGAIAVITYNLYRPNTLTSTTTYALTPEDYISQGGNIGKYGNFSNENDVAEFLNFKYPTAVPGMAVKLTYKIRLGATTQTVTKSFLFNTDLTWEGIFTLELTDYNALEQSFTNFADKDLAEKRIAIYLKSTYKPFAEIGDVQSVLFTYTYFDSSSARKFEDVLLKYKYDGTNWVVIPSLSTQTSNFKYKKGVWVSNNVIKYPFKTIDYTDAVTGLSSDTDLTDEVANLSRYGNFSRTGGTSGWEEPELLKAFNVVLKKNYPDAEEGQEFLVTVAVYNGTNTTEGFTVILDKSGSYIYLVQ
ncbi:hypothetical protein [Flavobacterium sp. 7A]|uniref:hypothetical protein n=1 Tax=Flavobacterium sp. 7A TaxID=2940571 RepID=UPI0022265092|nr:hypothetical protein [Flavobacterium sp. 7A]MCW2119143.1 hypothetical protein [Flavobacterium sp. 7A]